MAAVETVVATVGGLLLGLGLGLSLGRRAGARAVEARAATEARLRTSILPVLERRATELGLDTESDPGGPIDRAVSLASAIANAGPHRDLALSDTLEAAPTPADAGVEPASVAVDRAGATVAQRAVRAAKTGTSN